MTFARLRGRLRTSAPRNTHTYTRYTTHSSNQTMRFFPLSTLLVVATVTPLVTGTDGDCPPPVSLPSSNVIIPPSPVATEDGAGEPPSVGIVFPPPTRQEPEPTPPPFEICPPPPTPATSPDDSNSIVPPPVQAPIIVEDGGVLEPCPAPTAGGYPSADTMIPPPVRVDDYWIKGVD
jgi:hypothetical protein